MQRTRHVSMPLSADNNGVFHFEELFPFLSVSLPLPSSTGGSAKEGHGYGFCPEDLGLEFGTVSYALSDPKQVTCSETSLSHLPSHDGNIYFKRVTESY